MDDLDYITIWGRCRGPGDSHPWPEDGHGLRDPVLLHEPPGVVRGGVDPGAIEGECALEVAFRFDVLTQGSAYHPWCDPGVGWAP